MSRIRRTQEIPFKKISDRVEPFCLALKQKLRGSSSHFGREYLRPLLDEVVVDGKEVIVRGQYNNLVGAIG